MHNNIFSNIIYINILVFYLDETISYLCFLSLFNYVSSLGIRSFFRTHGDTGMLYFGAGKLFVVRRVSKYNRANLPLKTPVFRVQICSCSRLELLFHENESKATEINQLYFSFICIATVRLTPISNAACTCTEIMSVYCLLGLPVFTEYTCSPLSTGQYPTRKQHINIHSIIHIRKNKKQNDNLCLARKVYYWKKKLIDKAPDYDRRLVVISRRA